MTNINCFNRLSNSTEFHQTRPIINNQILSFCFIFFSFINLFIITFRIIWIRKSYMSVSSMFFLPSKSTRDMEKFRNNWIWILIPQILFIYLLKKWHITVVYLMILTSSSRYYYYYYGWYWMVLMLPFIATSASNSRI